MCLVMNDQNRIGGPGTGAPPTPRTPSTPRTPPTPPTPSTPRTPSTLRTPPTPPTPRTPPTLRTPPTSPTRVDLHCHSTASAAGRRALALPECATPPEEVYELAKRRAMDFVTITDHDTIAGVEQIADQPDVFISEELTAHFKGEPQAVHVLCFGITPGDHGWLQAHKSDVVACASYLHDHDIACALAHPFFPVAAPLTPAHLRVLADLFAVWETRNGRRPPEINAPAAVYIETQGGIGIGGSDDHGGMDIGRTFTETAPARTAAQLLAHIRAGRVAAGGNQGSAAQWAHSALAIAARTMMIDRPPARGPALDAGLAERILLHGDITYGSVFGALGQEDRRRLLLAWLHEMRLDTASLLDSLRAPEFEHSDLERRARRVHERRLTTASGDELLSACIPAMPYIPAATFLARQHAKLAAPAEEELTRVAMIADGAGRSLQPIRERGVPGYELELIGTGGAVDCRLPVVTEVELDGERHGVPSLFAVTEALTEPRYDLVHVCAESPAGIAAVLVARIMNVPVLGTDSGWRPGVDHELFNPARYAPEVLPGERFNVVGGGGHLLAEAFELARDRMPRLHLVASDGDPAVYATADLLVFADVRDGFCQPILEAQASGLPVLAVESDRAAELVESGRSGCLVPPDAQALATALVGLAKRATLRERLATGGLLAARERTWERSLAQLAEIYAAARAEPPVRQVRPAPAGLSHAA